MLTDISNKRNYEDDNYSVGFLKILIYQIIPHPALRHMYSTAAGSQESEPVQCTCVHVQP